jgi:hypothetical protein
MFADTHVAAEELEHIVQAVPESIAGALSQRAYYFVPLAIGDAEETMIAPDFTVELGDRASCHRNAELNGVGLTFISTRLMQDRFALAFEFFINVGHQFVDAVGVPQSFCDLVWAQALAGVRGETSQDAHESRQRARNGRFGDIGSVTRSAERTRATRLKERPVMPRTEGKAIDEKAKNSFFEAAFSDGLAIYMLSLALDFHYSDLREREYPLLAPSALAERLRHVANLFPANSGYTFQIADSPKSLTP